MVRSLPLVIFLVVFALGARAQDATSIREAFIKELSTQLLGSSEPFASVGNNQGWRGIVLVTPGSSTASLTEAYNGYSGDLIKSLTNTSLFDRPVSVRSGFCFFDSSSLATAWNNFLGQSFPIGDITKTTKVDPSWGKWLFQITPGQAKQKATQLRRPSAYLLSYREYERLYNVLRNGKESDLWRLEPKLKKFGNLAEAERAVLLDWTKLGHKLEIEAALEKFDNTQHSASWRAWSAARQTFDSNQLPLDQSSSVPMTTLLPPPAAWSELGSWMRLDSNVVLGGEILRYQLARVQVVRPWLQIEKVIDGTLRVELPTENAQRIFLSDGASPTYDLTPSGSMPAYVEELLLVRNIHNFGSPGQVQLSTHPLSSFAFPDSINLIGYVVRVLPKSPQFSVRPLSPAPPHKRQVSRHRHSYVKPHRPNGGGEAERPIRAGY